MYEFFIDQQPIVGTVRDINFKKKEPVLTLPQDLILIIAAMTQEPEKIRKALHDVLYYQKNNAKAYHSHKKKLRISA